MKEISQVIKKQRKKLLLTQQDLSILSWVNYDTIRKIETWVTKDPSFTNVMKIFSALNIDKWEFCKLIWIRFWNYKLSNK